MSDATSSPGRITIRVYYEDTDFSGVVYHAAYLRFLERGRTEFLRDLGVDQGQLFAAGHAFAVRAMQLEFRRAARMDDCIEIVSQIEAIGGAGRGGRPARSRGGRPGAAAAAGAGRHPSHDAGMTSGAVIVLLILRDAYIGSTRGRPRRRRGPKK